MKLRFEPLLLAVRSRPTPTSHLQPWLMPLFRDASRCKRFQSHQDAPKGSEPLRILYCGSDDFSCANLKALHEEHVKNHGLIESIEVVVRPGKRVGRGNKKIQHPPLRELAAELGLPIHERDTFTGWNMPTSINLVIAVSFGLFVPTRLLRAAKYGGLNVHPSLLPEYRGAAPLHWTLMDRKPITGVTLQTLDHKTFDAGVVLAQTALKDAYKVPPCCTVPELQTALTPLATDMLVQSLREGRHISPHRAAGWQAEREALGLSESPKDTDACRQHAEVHTRRGDWPKSTIQAEEIDGWAHRLPDPTAAAPKITTHMRQLVPTDARRDVSQDVVRRQNIIGPLWFLARDQVGSVKRVIVDGKLEASLRDAAELEQLGVFRRLELMRSKTAEAEEPQGASLDNKIPASTPAFAWIPKEADDIYLVGAAGQEARTAHPEVTDGKPDVTDGASTPGQAGTDCIFSVIKIGRLKVEGEKAKPAKLAFAQLAHEAVNMSHLKTQDEICLKWSFQERPQLRSTPKHKVFKETSQS